MEPTTVGQRIRAARLALGLSQVDVAQRLGLNRASISIYERGGTVPERSIEALCREFHISGDYLRTGRLPMMAPPDDSLLGKVMEHYRLPELFRAAVEQWALLDQREQALISGYLERCLEAAREAPPIETFQITAEVTGNETKDGQAWTSKS